MFDQAELATARRAEAGVRSDGGKRLQRSTHRRGVPDHEAEVRAAKGT